MEGEGPSPPPLLPLEEPPALSSLGPTLPSPVPWEVASFHSGTRAGGQASHHGSLGVRQCPGTGGRLCSPGLRSLRECGSCSWCGLHLLYLTGGETEP